MIRYYDVAIAVEQRGSAMLLTEPGLQGTLLASLADSARDGRWRLYVCEATEEEHAQNLEMAGVENRDEAAAIALAAAYQPPRTLIRTDPRTGTEQRIEVPEGDLRALLASGQAIAIGGDLLRDWTP